MVYSRLSFNSAAYGSSDYFIGVLGVQIQEPKVEISLYLKSCASIFLFQSEGLKRRAPANRTERGSLSVLLAGDFSNSSSTWNEKLEAQDFRYKLISTLGSSI